jgi:homogentisate 1,2-dioxygenase
MEFRCLHEAEEDHNIRQALYFDAIPRQMLGLAMAGLYHLWEQLAKQLLYRTLISAHHDRESLSRQLSKADFKTLEKWLNQFKWDGEQTSFECQHFYPGLNRLRLVANVVKHGYGASAMELQEMC